MNAKSNATKSTLVITVKAKELYEKIMNDDFNNLKKLIDECTELLDNEGFGSYFGDDNENYTTNIYEAGEMVWSIKVDDPKDKEEGYTVSLDFINQKVKLGKPGFFIRNPIPASNGIITGEVSPDVSPKSKPESYTINFHVSKGSKPTPNLPIDPKLQIRKN